MMKCMFCEEEAKIFLTQVEKEELKKICLCDNCSKDVGLLEKEGLIEAFSDNLIPSPETPQIDAEVESMSCVCGFSLEDLSNTGRLGCPICYETFSDILSAKVKSLHRGEEHIGKTLDIPETKHSVEKQIAEVNLALHTAVNEEEFEQAASLRDQLSSLEIKLSQL